MQHRRKNNYNKIFKNQYKKLIKDKSRLPIITNKDIIKKIHRKLNLKKKYK